MILTWQLPYSLNSLEVGTFGGHPNVERFPRTELSISSKVFSKRWSFARGKGELLGNSTGLGIDSRVLWCGFGCGWGRRSL